MKGRKQYTSLGYCFLQCFKLWQAKMTATKFLNVDNMFKRYAGKLP